MGGGEATDASPIPRIVVGVDNATGKDATVIIGPGYYRSREPAQHHDPASFSDCKARLWAITS